MSTIKVELLRKYFAWLSEVEVMVLFSLLWQVM